MDVRTFFSKAKTEAKPETKPEAKPKSRMDHIVCVDVDVPIPRRIPFEDDKFKWDYNDCGVVCRYDKEDESWEPMEDHCLDCGYRTDECTCEEDCEECGYTHHYEDKCPVGKQCEKFTKWREEEAPKACNGCGQTFPASQLHDHPSGAPDGSTDPYCRACELDDE